MRTLWVWSGAWECPPLVHFLNFTSLLVHVSPPRASLPCHASFTAGGEFGWARVVLVVHRPHEDCVGLEWCMGMPPLVHFLNFTSLLVHVSPPRASLSCHASFVAGGEFGWARVVLVVHRPHEDCVGLEWCMGMPPLVHFLHFTSLLVHVSPPRASLSCHASFAAGGEFGWSRVVLAVRHRPHEDGVGLEWCIGMPPLVHFLDFISLLVHVSPPCASLPCHASFAAASEFSWARVVLAVRAPAA